MQVAEADEIPLSREKGDVDDQGANCDSRSDRVGHFHKPDNQPGLDDNQRPEPEAFTGEYFAQHGITGSLCAFMS